MRRLEILLGRLWRDCCLGEGRSADFGVCRFRIAEGTWLQIDNVWKETIHVLFPLRRIADSGKADSSKRETEISDAKLLHIAEGESAVVSAAELSESDWKECIVILCGENIVPVSLKWRKYDGSQAVNLDFLSVEPEESGIKVFSDRYGLSQIGCIQGKTFDGQAETLYSGYLGRNEDMFDFPWDRFFLEKKGVKDLQFTAEFERKAGRAANTADGYRQKTYIRKNAESEEREVRNMGIISALLSGGILIGKICQGISGALSSMQTDEKNGLMASTDNLEFDDMKFIMLKGSENASARLYALNCSSDTKLIQFPPDQNGNCLSYEISGGEKAMIEDSVRAANPTDVAEISTMGESDAANGVPVVKVLLNGLKIGTAEAEIYVYGYRFRADGRGVWISGGKTSSVEYIDFSSESGIRVTSTNQIASETVSGEEGMLFPFEFENYGLKDGDVLSGELHFTPAENSMKGNNTKLSEPLTEEEKDFLKKAGVL